VQKRGTVKKTVVNNIAKSAMQRKMIAFSAILFLSVFILGSIAFTLLMERNLVTNTVNQMTRDLETKKITLEAAVNSEIGIVLKMAKSPLVKSYFSNPTDPTLERMAYDEFGAFEESIASNVIFWINDQDRMFYFSGGEPYKLDPYDSENYWYFYTIHETADYNFNINYNPEMDMMMLWVNAPVFNNEGTAIGMIGCGINLTEFINALYDRVEPGIEFFLFNTYNEITGTQNVVAIENKMTVDEKLGALGDEIISHTKTLSPGEVINFQPHEAHGVIILGSIPTLDWYIISIREFSTFDSLKNSMTVLFAIMVVVLLVILVVFNIFASKLLRESELAKKRAEDTARTLTENINYASKIQKNILPSVNVLKDTFSDYSVKWEPRDVVGGDIYWAKKFDDGTILCVCDCTGHGTSGAMLTMLTVSDFESTITEKSHSDTAQILYTLDKRLASVLHVDTTNKDKRGIMDINDGCDLAILFISNDGSVTISAGNINVFVCDGEKVTKIKGQSIFVGEGAIESKDDIKTVVVPYSPENKFYISSDGMFDQMGHSDRKRFGSKRFERIIIDNHNESQEVISSLIWEAFESYRGEEPRRDDFELISFKPQKTKE